MKTFNLYSKNRNFILYGIIGLIATVVDVSIFQLLINKIKINYIVANCVSMPIGAFLSFTLNSYYNFKVKNDFFKRFLTFFIIILVGFFISNVLIYLMVHFLTIEKLVAKSISIICVALLQFSLNKVITFKNK